VIGTHLAAWEVVAAQADCIVAGQRSQMQVVAVMWR
jgi:hypothetical protein